MTSDVEIDLLGPVEGRVNGQPVALGPPMQRAVLAVLAVELGRSVPVVDLIDRLWGDQPPRTAQKSIQKYVSRLRAVLGRTTIDYVADGYRLVLPDEAIDVRRLEADLATARAAPGAEVRHRALARLLAAHSGAVLAGLDADFAVTERSRVEELRLAAEEARLDAALDLGRLDEVVLAATDLTEAHPFREELWARLMVGLARSGRQAEAVRAYQRCRTVLATELGLEPGPALQRLEARVLAHDPDLFEGRAAAGGAGAVPVDGAPAERRELIVVAAGERPPTAMGATDTLRTAAAAHGGRPGATADGTVVVFGLPAHDDDTLRAAQAALALHSAGSRPVAVVGGPAVVVDGPDGLTLDDELAARAWALTRSVDRDPGGPVLGPSVARRLAPVARIEGGGERPPVLVELASAAHPPGVDGTGLETPFVGRTFELGRLVDLWQAGRAVAGPQLVLVTGEGGIGKTRLLGELRARIEPETTSWLAVSCRDRADGPFSAIARLFGAAFGPDPMTALEYRLASWGLAEGEAAWLRHHLALLYLAPSTPSVDHDESLRAWAQLLNRDLGEGGVVTIDDYHLAPAALRQLVDELLTTASGALLVLGALRPEAGPELLTSPAGHPTAVVPLTPLAPSACGRLARTLLGSTPEAAGEVARRSGGNPYFLHELARTVTETGAVDDAPATVRQAVAARIDRAGDLARLVLQTASVVDAGVTAETLADLTGLPIEAVGSALAVLRRRQFMAGVEEAPSSHRVVHPLVAEVAARQVTPARALAIHRAMTDGLAPTGPDASIERLERVDAHAARAEELARALGHPDLPALRRAAGRTAFDLGQRLEPLDGTRSGEVLARAVDRLEPGTVSWARAAARAGQAASLRSDWAEAERLLGQAIDVFARAGDRRAEAEARVQLDNQRRMRGDDRAGRQVALALDLVGDDPGPELATAVSWHAALLAMAGRPDEAVAVAAEHQAMVEAHGSDEARLRLLNSVALARVDAGDESALDELARVHRLAVDLGLTRQAISAANNLANNLWLYRGPSHALPLIEEARAFAIERRQDFNFDYLSSTQAEILFDLGAWDRALRLTRPLLGRPDWSQMTASAAWVVGQVRMWRDEEGWTDLLDDAQLDRVRRIGDLQHVSPWLAVSALAAARLGDADRVRSLVGELRDRTEGNARWRSAELPRAARALVMVDALDEGRGLVPDEPLTLPRAELSRRTAGAVLAVAAGRIEDAVPELSELVERWSVLGVPLEEGLAASHLATALDRAGRAGAAETARRRAAAVLAALGITGSPDGWPFDGGPGVLTGLGRPPG